MSQPTSTNSTSPTPSTSTTKATTTSFRDALALGIPLSSKGSGHAPSMPRGQSCLACRKRKVKCDGVRPACGGCRKSAIAHGEDPDSFACPYDDPVERPNKRKKPASATAPVLIKSVQDREKVQSSNQGGPTARELQLQAKLAELEAKLASFTSITGSISASGLTTSTRIPIPMPNDEASSNLDFLLQATTAGQGQSIPAPIDPAGADQQPSDPMFFGQTTTTASLATPDDALILDLLYPGWPRDLPSPGLVHRLLGVWFAKSHICNDMINEGRFLAAMSLPPTHPRFPHPSLIHAILASTARMVSEDFFEQEQGYWRRGFEGFWDENPADYHARRAKIAADDAVVKGVHLFRVQQAMVLLSYHWYTSAKYVEVWLGCGLATRLTGPLGLNHLRSKAQQASEEQSTGERCSFTNRKAALMPPPEDDEDLYERSVTFWLAVCADRFASASTNWPVSIDEMDITSLLPSRDPSLDTLNLDESPLSLKNPNFWISHPPHLVGGMQLFIKSILLVGRVITYMQRDGLPNRFPACSIDARTTPAFRKLENDIIQFRLSVPKEFTLGVHSMFSEAPVTTDNRLCLIHTMPHVATILLHEPFVTMQENDASFAKCTVSARAILDSIYNIWSTSFEIGYLAPFINLAYSIAGRTFVRDMAIKQSRDPNADVTAILADVEVVLAAMRAYKTPLGLSCAHSLHILLEDPKLTLPNMTMNCMPYNGSKVPGDGESPCFIFPDGQLAKYANGPSFSTATPSSNGSPNPFQPLGSGAYSSHLSPISSSASPTNNVFSSSNGGGGNGTRSNTSVTSGPSPASMFEYPTTPSNSLGGSSIDPTQSLFGIAGTTDDPKSHSTDLDRFAEVSGAFGTSWAKAT